MGRKSVTIMGVDPGVTTGYAIVEYRVDGSFHRQFTGNMLEWQTVKTLAKLDFDFAAVENFTLLAAHSINDKSMTASKILGGLTYLIPESQLYIMEPSAKQGCPNSVLKQLTLWDSDDSTHVRDALRHCVLLVRRLQRESKLVPKQRKKSNRT